MCHNCKKMSSQLTIFVSVSISITKKLTKLGNSKAAYKQIGRWSKAISSHLYYTIGNSEPKSKLRQDMWLSTTNHVCDIHEHDSEEFPQCRHDPLENIIDDKGVEWERDWLIPGNNTAKCLHNSPNFVTSSPASTLLSVYGLDFLIPIV